MEIAQWYQYIYVFVLFILILIVGRRYSGYPLSRVRSAESEPFISSLILAASMILFIGYRPISTYFCDMIGYANIMLTTNADDYVFEWNREWLFSLLVYVFRALHASPRTFIVVLAAINIGCAWIATRKLFPHDALIALLVVFITFTEFATMVNGIRAGCARSILLCAIAYRDNWKVGLSFLFCAFGIHHGIQIAAVPYVLCLFIKDSRLFFAVWGLSLVAAMFHFQGFQTLFGSISDESGSRYLMTDMEDSNFGGRNGFRLDFVLFSCAPIIVGYYSIFKKKINSKLYSFILNLYLATNAIWLLCMYVPYNNRIAEISWGIFPIALIYPFFKENISDNQYSVGRNIIILNAAFSLFMEFIYYLILK